MLIKPSRNRDPIQTLPIWVMYDLKTVKFRNFPNILTQDGTSDFGKVCKFSDPIISPINYSTKVSLLSNTHYYALRDAIEINRLYLGYCHNQGERGQLSTQAMFLTKKLEHYTLQLGKVGILSIEWKLWNKNGQHFTCLASIYHSPKHQHLPFLVPWYIPNNLFTRWGFKFFQIPPIKEGYLRFRRGQITPIWEGYLRF